MIVTRPNYRDDSDKIDTKPKVIFCHKKHVAHIIFLFQTSNDTRRERMLPKEYRQIPRINLLFPMKFDIPNLTLQYFV